MDEDAEAVPTITVSGIEDMPLLSVERFDALGQQRHDFPVLCHNLPLGTRQTASSALTFSAGKDLPLTSVKDS